MPGSTTSLPVDRIATRGRANTSTSAPPIAASAPMRLGLSRSPRRDDEIARRDVGAAPSDVLAGRGRGEHVDRVRRLPASFLRP